ncbi:MAG TPA: L-threonylcarbamoyladenylate synthase [Nitrospiria bacterium]|jgi:L-threonylcarbamoyladenylate synthase|nr:L-threonylcarbamoyladenylate synthase [Nitrospiria bacterium]
MSKPKIKRSSEKIVRVDPVHPQPELLAKAADLIHRGGVIAFPTETFYGLGADALNRQAIERIYAIKGRDRSKPILILVEARDRINAFVKPFPSMAERLMTAFWPGPLTILFQANDRLPIELTAGTGKIGIRFPSHPVVRALLSAVGVPLTGTSANRADGRSPQTAEEVRNSIGLELDLILDGGSTPGEKPSTVLDCTTSPFQIVREGIVSRGDLETVIGKIKG